jgi:hypothetical protein
MNVKTRKAKHTAASKISRRKLDAFPDRIDLRDWPYQPTLAPLHDELDNRHCVPEILDQGMEGACTGFALAGTINYLLAERGLRRRVSPRMIYEMARCHDDWPGETYEGSSACGAIKTWARHGVCERKLWPDSDHGRGYLTEGISKATASGWDKKRVMLYLHGVFALDFIFYLYRIAIWASIKDWALPRMRVASTSDSHSWIRPFMKV